MTVEEAITDRLAADAGVSGFVATRVWQLKLPQNPALPAVLVQLISEPQDTHLRGTLAQTVSRVQVDCYGRDTGTDPYEAVSNVAAAVNAALVGQPPFTVDDRYVQMVRRISRRALYEGDELRLVRVTQDFEVFSETV